MAKFEGLELNGVKMPDYLRIKGIEHSLLPPVSQNLMSISGREGAYDFGNEIGVREIAVDVMIILEEENTLPQKLEELAGLLYYKEAKKLVLGDDVNRHYMAKYTGSSEFDEEFLKAEGTLTFVCPEPFKYGLDRQSLIPADYDGGVIPVYNLGNYSSVPRMKFEITEDVTNFSVVAGEDFIDLGQPYEIDTSTVVNLNPHAFYDQLTTTNGWTDLNSLEGGNVAGTFEVYDSHAFRQAGGDYGTGTMWHGGSMMKPLDNPVQDFDMKFNFRIRSSADEVGRVQFRLLDINGKLVFRTHVKDVTPNSSRLTYEFWAYDTAGNGKLIGSKKFDSSMTDLAGSLIITRKGREIEGQIIDLSGNVLESFFLPDHSDLYQAQIAQANVHLGQYKTHPVSSILEARDIVISELKGEADEENGEIPLILQAGDVLEIDNETGAIMKNNRPFFEYLNPQSTFIELQKGNNGLMVSPASSFTNGEITYTERSI